MTGSPEIFDRRLLRRRRERAAARFAAHDFLLREVAERLTERLEDVKRRFPHALDLGCHDGRLARSLAGRGGGVRLVQCDLSAAFLQRARDGGPVLAADEEQLPFQDRAFDLVLSCLALQWVNDLPGCLLQINRILKPDGLLLAAFLGGDSLADLRAALMQAELETTGGASPRVAPFVELRQAGALLQRAGFALPVADQDAITVNYRDPFRLLTDLRGMGWANALKSRKPGGLRRDTLFRALELYRQEHGRPDGTLPVRFEVVYLTGWAPDASQPRPLRPGSAKKRLAEALDSEERSAGETAPRQTSDDEPA